MEKLFATYEPSKLMKEIGFVEPCLGYFVESSKELRLIEGELFSNNSYSGTNDFLFTAPLYQQVIDWFREKHKLNAYVEYCNWNGVDEAWWEYTINIMDKDGENIFSEKYFNHQECSDDLILKLIETVKEKNK